MLLEVILTIMEILKTNLGPSRPLSIGLDIPIWCPCVMSRCDFLLISLFSRLAERMILMTNRESREFAVLTNHSKPKELSRFHWVNSIRKFYLVPLFILYRLVIYTYCSFQTALGSLFLCASWLDFPIIMIYSPAFILSYVPFLFLSSVSPTIRMHLNNAIQCTTISFLWPFK